MKINSYDDWKEVASKTVHDEDIILNTDIHLSKNEMISSFKGNLKGNGYTIYSNGNINGLINVNYGNIEDVNFSGFENGGIIQKNRGTIKNCSVESEISSTKWTRVGFLNIINYGKIIGCTVRSSINTSNDVGGICYENNGLVENSCFNGFIKSEKICGGIACINKEKIVNCSVTGYLYGCESAKIGGIAGLNEKNTEIENCEFNGSIKSENTCGGICAKNKGKIKKCQSSGLIMKSWVCGGICGLNDKGTIELGRSKSYLQAKIVGGISGTNQALMNKADIRDCYFDGKICGDKVEGNLIGRHISNSSIKRSYRSCNFNLSKGIGGCDEKAKVEDIDEIDEDDSPKHKMIAKKI